MDGAHTIVGGAIGNNLDPVRIGRRKLSESHFFDGKIDELRIWNTARTQSEIQNNINNCLNGSETGLVG